MLLILFLLVLSLGLNIWLFAGQQTWRGVMRAALRQADEYAPGGRDHIRIPYNQAAMLVQWDSPNFPMRDKSEFRSKPGPHPAVMHFTRRRKLKGV